MPLCHPARGIADAFAGVPFPPEPNPWVATLQGSIKLLAAPNPRIVRLGRDGQGDCPTPTF